MGPVKAHRGPRAMLSHIWGGLGSPPHAPVLPIQERPGVRRPAPPRRAFATRIGIVLVATAVAAGCGGSDSGEEELTAEDARANLEDAGYGVDEVTSGANEAIGPKGKLDADVYLSIGQGPEGEVLYIGGYFFSDPDDRDTYAAYARVDHVSGEEYEAQPVVEGQGVFTNPTGTQEELDAVVEAARGD
jgi:hypothetical protein